MPSYREHIKGAVKILAVTAVIAFTVNLFNPGGYVLTVREKPSGQVVMITAEEARIKYDGGKGLFIDSRRSDIYEASHINGSISIPLFPEAAYTGGIKKYFTRLQSPVEIIIYCDGESCGTSKKLAERLIGMGYRRHIYILKSGFPGWEKEGYPVDR